MILPQIDTKEYYNIFMQQLDMLLLDLYGYSDEELMKRLSTTYDYKFTHIILSYLGSNSLTLTSSNTTRVDDCLRVLKNSLLDVNTLELHIAFQPTLAFVNKLNSWVTLNLPDNTLIDIKFNPRVLAGARIYFNGKFIDSSFDSGLLQAEKGLL